MESCVRKKKSALGIRLVMLVVVAALQLHGMERWAALSQIESGENDKAVGAAGEISRYQIKPEVWRRYAESDADWQDPEASLAVAREIMRERCTDFEATYHRAPTDREFYILWNAPARIQSPSKTVTARAERFCNLVAVK